FFFQAEDGIRDFHVTGVQTCALPIWGVRGLSRLAGRNPSAAARGCTVGGRGHLRYYGAEQPRPAAVLPFSLPGRERRLPACGHRDRKSVVEGESGERGGRGRCGKRAE